MDHALFAQHRAMGRTIVIQTVWIYEHPIDFDGVRRFNENLGRGLLGRRIERSPLPFARHRWTSDPGPSEIDIAECPRPRAELSDWADERSQLPIDPESGPGWHIGVLPLTDGSTAVSLVVSHYLIDGFGLALTIADAVVGNTRNLGYPPPRSRTRLRAMAQDARQTAQDAPEIARALGAAARLARGRRQVGAQPPVPRPVALGGGGDHGTVDVPVITIHLDLDHWNTRATALGGTSKTLVAGLAAKFGERLGRRRAGDGAVTLLLPISERTEADTRAIAVSFARVSVIPELVTKDLRDARAAIKRALRASQETPDESLQLIPLAPLASQRALKRMADAEFTDPDLPVPCSDLGDLGSVVYALARTDSDYVTVTAHLNTLHLIRGVWQNVTRQELEQSGGQLRLLSWRIGGKIGITVAAYQLGAENTKSALRELAARTLAEFGLVGEIE